MHGSYLAREFLSLELQEKKKSFESSEENWEERENDGKNEESKVRIFFTCKMAEYDFHLV